jgi:hypothetical protein
MPSESPLARILSACCLAGMLAACAAPAVAPAAAPAPVPAPEPMRVIVPASPSPMPVTVTPAPPVTPPPMPPAGAHPLEAALSYAERVRAVPAAELAQEVQRLGDTSYSPLRATQLALALAQSRTAGGAARAQSLLQRVLADGSSESQALQPYARLLSAQIAEQRRTDDQAERQAQQLRDAQRRIDQLNDRLEAVRAIERSLPGPARRDPARP